MKRVKWGPLVRKGRALFLAYDQGMEHGPVDFNDDNVDPLLIIDIAQKGGFSGLVFHKGIAEKYNDEIRKSKVPLIIKLNGKTSLVKGEPISRQLCSVKEARQLGALAVGYTVYIGSEHESEMLQEFEGILREAHEFGMPVIAWMYPRGKSLEGKTSSELLAYSARVALEIGADMAKVIWNGSTKDLKWAVEAAGRTKVVVAGGMKVGEKDFVKSVSDVMKCDAVGLAVGRNVWQSKQPVELSKKIGKIVFG